MKPYKPEAMFCQVCQKTVKPILYEHTTGNFPAEYDIHWLLECPDCRDVLEED